MNANLSLLLVWLGSASGLLLLPRGARTVTPTLHRRGDAAMTQPVCQDPMRLPGDPSLLLHTNVALTPEEKDTFMGAASKAIASCLGKPESYVAVCVADGASLIFGGSPAPAAIGCVYSLGSINKENNGALTAAISDLLAVHDVPNNRIYLNFFDVPRENCGWSGRTFAG